MAELILNKNYGLTVAASIFTSIGLGQNDLAQMIGGMIISPLAHPIMESIMVGDILTNMTKLIIMILTCVVIGMIYFSIFLSSGSQDYTSSSQTNPPRIATNDSSSTFRPTERMIDIADPELRGYWSDIIYGLVAGMVVYASYGAYEPGDINILAGMSVGVTILPAFVNAGIMFGAGLHGYRDHELTNLSYYGLTSSIVGMIYLIFIFVGFLAARSIDENFGDSIRDT